MSKLKKKIFMMLAFTMCAFTLLGNGQVNAAEYEEQQTYEETTVTESLINFVTVESPYIESPGEQKIVLSFGDGAEYTSDERLIIEKDDGTEKVLELADQDQELYLFQDSFVEGESGVYTLKKFEYTLDGTFFSLDLEEYGLNAMFGVDTYYPGYEPEKFDTSVVADDIEMSVVELDSGDVLELNTDIDQALQITASAIEASNARVNTQNRVVVLDPGHGGYQGGAEANGLREKDLTLKIAWYCKAELEQYSGVIVYMTRTDDSYVSLSDRVAKAKNWGADVFVSIHINSSPTSAAEGAEVWYPNSGGSASISQTGKGLAQSILNRLLDLGLKNRGVFYRDATNDETYDDGSTADYYSVINGSKRSGFPGIIVEHAFISNSSDAAKLAQESFLQQCGIADATGIADFFGLVKGDWVTDNHGTWFKYSDGSYPYDCWLYVQGAWYYFDASGYRCVDFQHIGNKTYYFNQDGQMVTGWKQMDDIWYYFKDSGEMATDWCLVGGDTWYYFDTDGHMQTGLKTIRGKQYYFKSSGAMVTDWKQLDDIWYYFSDGGSAQIGWKQIKNIWYYFDTKGHMEIGFQVINGKTYYFDDNGAMVTGTHTINNRSYTFDNSGALMQKLEWVHSGSSWYYQVDDKNVVGWEQIDNTWYYFDEDGKMQTGLQKLNGAVYCFDDSGAMLTGWRQRNGSWYYFSEWGTAQTGWKQLKNIWYYFDKDGRMATGWTDINLKTYYFDNSGAMVTGTVKINGVEYNFGNDGALEKTESDGWVQDKNGWYYYANNTRVVGWTLLDGSWYYFDNNGVMQTGLQEVNGKIYCFNDSGAMITGWKQYNGSWYYFSEWGTAQTGWKQIQKTWYYFENSGIMVTGWLQSGDKWYYLDASGSMITGWKQISGTWYYFNKDRSPEGELSYEGVTTIMGNSMLGDKKTAVNKMVKAYVKSGRTYPADELSAGGAASIEVFCTILYEEAESEGVKPEVVFAQSMLETGYLRFGGDILIDQYNFAGLGATGNGVHGEKFADVRTGLRAQVQHLKAYASDQPLNNACVDNRFKYVKRSVAPYVEWLGIQENPIRAGWAASKNYGFSLVNNYLLPMYML